MKRDAKLTPTCQPPDSIPVGKIYIHDWHEWQSHRTDRGAPPWIKVHRNLATNEKWVALSDSEKGQLISLWIAAADREGFLPSSAAVLKKICLLDKEPDLNKFSNSGFIDGVDAKLTPSGGQVDAKLTHQRRVEKSRGEESISLVRNFDDFWKAYPIKKGKGAAQKAWGIKNPPIERCIETIKNFQEHDRAWKEGFVPHPTTWINQERWNDEPEEDRALRSGTKRGPLVVNSGAPDKPDERPQWKRLGFRSESEFVESRKNVVGAKRTPEGDVSRGEEAGGRRSKGSFE